MARQRTRKFSSYSFALVTTAVFLAVSGTVSASLLSWDFNLPDGTTGGFAHGAVLATNANADAQVIGGRVRLTQSTNSNNAAFHIPALANSTSGFSVSFDYELSDLAGGNPPADGFSFSYGDIPFGGLSTQAEEGWPGESPVISWEMDSWRAGDSEVGPAIAVDGGDVAFTNGDLFLDGQTISGTININLDSTGVTSFTSTGAITNAAFASIASGFTLDNNHSFAIAARTGGATETLFIDNLVIQSNQVIPEPTTLVIWSALGGIGLVAGRWRRRKNTP